MGNGCVGGAHSVFPDNFRETCESARGGYLKDRLHQSCGDQRAQAVSPQYDDRPLNRLDRLTQTIEGAVRHFQQATDQRRIAGDDRSHPAARDLFVIDRVHQLRQQIGAPWEVLLLSSGIGNGGERSRHDAIMFRQRLPDCRHTQLELAQLPENLRAVENLSFGGGEHRRLRQVLQIDRKLRHDLSRGWGGGGSASGRSAQDGPLGEATRRSKT